MINRNVAVKNGRLVSFILYSFPVSDLVSDSLHIEVKFLMTVVQMKAKIFLKCTLLPIWLDGAKGGGDLVPILHFQFSVLAKTDSFLFCGNKVTQF